MVRPSKILRCAPFPQRSKAAAALAVTISAPTAPRRSASVPHGIREIRCRRVGPGATGATGAGAGALSGQGQTIKRNSTTRFFGKWFNFVAAIPDVPVVSNATESTMQEAVVSAFTVSSLKISLSAAAGSAGNGYTFTVRKGGVDTAVTCQILGTATSCTDTTNSVSFAAGDLFSIKAVSSAAGAVDNLDAFWIVK